MNINIKKREVMVMLPTSLNYQDLEKVGKKSVPNFDLNIVKFILGRILFSSVIYNQATDTQNYCNHSRISRNFWVKHIGSTKYKAYINLLLNLKIINRSPYSEDKGECFGYGLTKPYRFSRIFCEVIPLKTAENLKVKATKTSYVKKYEKPLIDFFDNTRFSVDTEVVENLVFKDYFSVSAFPIEYSHGNPTKQGLAAYSNYLMAIKKMVKFMNGIYSFSRAHRKTGKEYKTYSRFYNPFAFLNKEIRANMYYDNKKLHEIDIKNSIPYFLSVNRQQKVY